MHKFQEPEVQPVRAPRWGLATVVVLLLWFTPLAFGAVHTRPHLMLQCVVYLLVMLVTVKQMAAVRHLLSTECVASRWVLVTLSLLMLYCGGQLLWLWLSEVPHPVLGATSRLADVARARDTFRELLCFCGAFLVVRMCVQRAPQVVMRHLLWVGPTIAFVALMHWVNDTGELFWLLSPVHQPPSHRAHWPFVNPNSLGQYLLPLWVLLCAQLFYRGSTLVPAHARDSSVLITKKYMTGQAFQHRLVKLFIAASAVVVTSVALLGTQSRGALAGSLGALALYLIGERLVRPSPPPARRTSRHENRPSAFDATVHLALRWTRPLCVAGMVALISLFFAQRGADLLTDRLDAGLMARHDDLRLQLYRDTLPLLRDHLWWGVGLGQWEAHFPRYMNPALAGLNPVYLHSDPYQLLVEVGVLGVLPVLMLLGGLFWFVGQSIVRWRAYQVHASHEELAERMRLIVATVSGCIGLGISSFVDFPFRIPAITFLGASLLALLASNVDAVLLALPKGTKKDWAR